MNVQHIFFWTCTLFGDLPGGSGSKEFACNAKDLGSISGLGRSPGEGNGNPLQYSSLENLMDRGAWQATVHGVAKSRTWLSNEAHRHATMFWAHLQVLRTERWLNPLWFPSDLLPFPTQLLQPCWPPDCALNISGKQRAHALGSLHMLVLPQRTCGRSARLNSF